VIGLPTHKAHHKPTTPSPGTLGTSENKIVTTEFIMTQITENQIKEIASQLDCGFRCFVERTTGELVFIPDADKYPDIEIETWSNEIEKIESDHNDFAEIEPLESKDTFMIMAQFVESVNDTELKNKLISALNRRSPFREFKFVIDYSGEYRQKWFDFKNHKIQDWVRENIIILDEL